MGLEEDFGAGPVENQRLQRLVVVAALLAAGEELAVREGAGSALAEGVVRLGVDLLVAVDAGDVPFAVQHVASALQHDGAVARFDETQGGEQPRRARSHYHDLRGVADIGIVEPHRFGLRLAVDVDLQREVDLHLPLPGVDGALENADQRDLLVADTHAAGCGSRVDATVCGLFGR